MKKTMYGALLILAMTGGLSSLPVSKASAQQVSVSFQAFYDGLGPYGTWVNYPAYGYVWIPTAVPFGFRPYATGGHWAYTPDGWLWVSDYEWGWAVYHYGNWFYDEGYGWMWAPGYDWAPAWVTWGEYQGNYCWAPIAPRLSVSIVSYRPPHYYWNFVPRQYITSPRVTNYVRANNTTVVNNITVINNINKDNGRGTFMRGPQPQSVERYTHTAVRPVQIREASRPERTQVQNGQMVVYRPAVNRNNNAAKPAPGHVQDMHALKRNDLPAANNRNVQPKTPVDNGRARPNANPGNNPVFNNKPNTPAKPAARPPADNNKPVQPRPSLTDPVRNHPVNPDNRSPVNKTNPTHNKPVMNNLPANNNRPATQPVNKPATAPAPRANHSVPNPANTRPNVPERHPVQQPRPNPAPATHPQPAHERPAAQPGERGQK